MIVHREKNKESKTLISLANEPFQFVLLFFYSDYEI